MAVTPAAARTACWPTLGGVPDLTVPSERFRDDDGSAEPRLAAALSEYAAGRESEHAVLTALARARLLVPVVAAVTQDGEKTSDMALPLLSGRDGRRAIVAFTSLGALTAWRQEARPLPVPADLVWRAAIDEQVPAVVVDVAGPVPLVVEGARLAALAAGRPVPAAHEDPDVRAAVDAVVAGDPAIAAARLAAGSGDGDLTVHLLIAPGQGAGQGAAAGPDPAAGPGAAGARAAAAIMAALAGRLRRGIEVTVVPPRRLPGALSRLHPNTSRRTRHSH
jgi:SseB protein N-terminal domain